MWIKLYLKLIRTLNKYCKCLTSNIKSSNSMHQQQLSMEIMKLVWANRLLNFHQIKAVIGVCLIMFVWMTICNDVIGVVDIELILTDYEKINIKCGIQISYYYFTICHLPKFCIKFLSLLRLRLSLTRSLTSSGLTSSSGLTRSFTSCGLSSLLAPFNRRLSIHHLHIFVCKKSIIFKL